MRTPHLMRMSSVKTLAATAQKGEIGRTWYEHAHSQILEAAPMLGTTPQRLADILALFSPRISVKRNIRFAVHYIQTGDFLHGTMRPTRAAILHYEATGEIRGPKTSAFARAILNEPSAVVLDVWMARALCVPQAAFNRKPLLAKATSRIEKAASELGWHPHETQAAIWTATVRAHNRKPAPFTILQPTLFGKEFQ